MWIRIISFNKMTSKLDEGPWTKIPDNVVDRLEEEVKKPEKGLVFWLERSEEEVTNG